MSYTEGKNVHYEWDIFKKPKIKKLIMEKYKKDIDFCDYCLDQLKIDIIKGKDNV